MTTEIKERPILFSGPMVREILDGRKTQTRRVVKFPKWMQDGEGGQAPEIPKQFDGYVDMVPVTAGHVESFCKNPYGYVGDRLWVRETWGPCDGGFCYAASEGPDVKPDDGKWHPSIHMFRHASRINLEITGVRVERLNEITEEDALAEGVEPTPMNDAKVAFDNLWVQINGPGSVDANPWVWVIEFKRVAP